jgi:hypothetical protein
LEGESAPQGPSVRASPSHLLFYLYIISISATFCKFEEQYSPTLLSILSLFYLNIISLFILYSFILFKYYIFYSCRDRQVHTQAEMSDTQAEIGKTQVDLGKSRPNRQNPGGSRQTQAESASPG